MKIPKMILRIGNKIQKQESCSPSAVFLRVNGQGKRNIFGILSLTLRSLCIKSKKGLTLIEVLMAVSILAIGIIGVLRAFAGSVATLEVGQNSIEAVNLLKQKVADVKQMILEDGETASSSDSGTSDDFLWQWDIRPTDIENLNELTLTVSHNYNPRTFSLKTYVVDPDEEKEE